MHVPLLLLLIFFLSIVIGAGELVWLGIVVWIAGDAMFRSEVRWRRFVMPALACAVVVFHSFGYKFYGAPVLHDNREVMASSHQMVALEPPSTVVCADGSRLVLKNTTLDPDMSIMFTPEAIYTMFGRTSTEPVMVGPDDNASGVVVQRRIQYWCGNTWFPTWFPKRLPYIGCRTWGLLSKTIPWFPHQVPDSGSKSWGKTSAREGLMRHLNP